ncbi:MAG: C39 family peptidase [Methanomicrobiales archaeon]|nr:C39 family peptidase [Methanomicrobiales archaeon]
MPASGAYRKMEAKQMRLFRWSAILLALLLAAMAMVPIVSADNYSKEKFNLVESNYISSDAAYKNAVMTMQEFILSGSLNAKWDGATLNPQPLVIYDLNGAILTYQFTAEKNGMKIGVANSAASKIIGGPILAIGMSPTNFEEKTIDSKINGIISTTYLDYNILSKNIVAYQYPKLGVLVQISNSKTGEMKKIIIDVYDFSIIPEEKSVVEGTPGAWSFYDEMSLNQMNENVQKWGNLQKSDMTPQYASEKTLSYTRYDQASENWCAVAVAQMNSQFYEHSHTQQAIADIMGNGDGDGSTPEMELTYYQASTESGGLDKQNSIDVYSSSANWNNAADEIDADRPLKVGNMGHARAIAGYKIQSGSNYLYIYDPNPSLTDPFWEMYTGTYNNYVYVR